MQGQPSARIRNSEAFVQNTDTLAPIHNYEVDLGADLVHDVQGVSGAHCAEDQAEAMLVRVYKHCCTVM